MRTKTRTKLTSFQLDAQFHHPCHLKEVLHSDQQHRIAKTQLHLSKLSLSFNNPPCHSRQINRNYRDIESRSHRSISPHEHSHSHCQSRKISFLKSTVESLINEVNKLKSDKATTSNDPSEYVDVDDTETTSVMGTTGLSCPMDNIGLSTLVIKRASKEKIVTFLQMI
ncbi:5494_t:CDS:2 [Gigaspora rosea]|nr:5494_t:CDS:2 [Gigaspora rosea]